MNTEDRSRVHQALLSRRHAIADDWHKAIARTSFVSLKAAEVRQHLVELTEEVIALLLTEPFEHDRAEAIGASLAGFRYVEPEALGRTQEVLARQLVEGLPTDQVIALQPRLAALLGGLATGFFQQARETTLSEQEQIRGSMIAELQRTQEALQKAYDEVEQQVQERTAELRVTNESLQREITERKRAGAALKESLEQIERAKREWESTADSLLQFVCLLDHRGRIIRANRAMERWNLGRVEDVKGWEVHELFHPGCTDPACYLETFWLRAWEELAQGRPAEWEAEDRVLKRHLHVQVRPILAQTDGEGEEGASFAVASVLDITERKRAEEEIEQRNRELSALNAIAATVSGFLNLEEILDRTLDKVLEVAGMEVGSMYLLDQQTEELVLATCRGVSKEFADQVRILKMGESLTGRVAQSGEPIVVDDVTRDPRVTTTLLSEETIRSFAVIPMKSKEKVQGIMYVASHKHHLFSSEEVQLYIAIGNQIGVAIHNARLWHETKRRLQESTILLEVSRALASVLELDHLLQLIVDSALETIEIADSGVIHLLDDATGRLYPKAMAGKFFRVISKQAMYIGEGIAGLALEQGEVINASDVNTDPRFIKLRGTHEFKSLLATPLVADGENIGTISICSRQIGAFAREDERLMMTLAAHAAIAVKNAQLFARSEQLAMLKERNRIACEIHDGLAQNLASLSMKIDFCLGLIDSDLQATKAVLSEAKAFVRENIREIRRSIFALHPPALKELGFLAALRKYAQEFQEQNALPVHLSIVGEEVQSQLSLRYEYELFRIVQEALNNVRRHARAKNVWISIDLSALDVVSLTVMDDGLGFDAAEQERASPIWARGFGLTGMEERTKALGGKLLVETEPGSGTKITAILPLGLSPSA